MARWAYGVGWFGGLGAAVAGLIAACLPDLAPNLCGNGHIDPGESCDPGPNADPGCSATCKLVCPPPPNDAGRSFIDNASSNHCYYATRGTQTFSDGLDSCFQLSAHVVTVVDSDEAGDMVTQFGPIWPGGARYWLGLQRTSSILPYTSSGPNEPGWAAPAKCPGCFAYGLTAKQTVIPSPDAGVDAAATGCVVTAGLAPNTGGKVEAAGCDEKAEVICEREPVGARSVPCLGGTAFCFDVLATFNPNVPSGASKHYVYNPTPMTASDAEAFCRSSLDAGKASLVVFESRAEREQVIYELSQITSLLPGGGRVMPSQLWIGLSGPVDAGVRGDAGRAAAWVWDDGVHASPTATGARPSVWGNYEPKAGASGRAYIQVQASYDTGLAYVRNDSPSNPQQYPSVCQY